jgi:hypothetical protein
MKEAAGFYCFWFANWQNGQWCFLESAERLAAILHSCEGNDLKTTWISF